jgi:hypothetical protein
VKGARKPVKKAPAKKPKAVAKVVAPLSVGPLVEEFDRFCESTRYKTTDSSFPVLVALGRELIKELSSFDVKSPAPLYAQLRGVISEISALGGVDVDKNLFGSALSATFRHGEKPKS